VDDINHSSALEIIDISETYSIAANFWITTKGYLFVGNVNVVTTK